MRVFARFLASSAAFATLVATPSALLADDLRVVEPSAVASNALACRGVPDDYVAAGRTIAELGWQLTATNQPGPGREAGQMFERNGMILVLTPADQEGHPMACSVMGAVRASVPSSDVTAAVTMAVGRQPGPGDVAGDPVWHLDGGQIMSVAARNGTVFFTFWYPRNSAH
jgi:hypothetical protein